MSQENVMGQKEVDAAARDNYDRMANAYWNHVEHETTVRSLALTGLEYFAHLVQKSGPGPVADIGCGPGHITALLADLGLDVFGVDISPALLAIASETHPDLRFEIGEFASLPIESDSLRAIVAKHSLIHTPAALVPAALNEFTRVLMPDGQLCVSFFAAEAPATHGDPFDHAVTTAYRFDVDAMAAMLAAAGLIEEVRLVRQPTANERQLPHAMLFARLV